MWLVEVVETRLTPIMTIRLAMSEVGKCNCETGSWIRFPDPRRAALSAIGFLATCPVSCIPIPSRPNRFGTFTDSRQPRIDRRQEFFYGLVLRRVLNNNQMRLAAMFSTTFVRGIPVNQLEYHSIVPLNRWKKRPTVSVQTCWQRLLIFCRSTDTFC
jgi:hypothetical protein